MAGFLLPARFALRAFLLPDRFAPPQPQPQPLPAKPDNLTHSYKVYNSIDASFRSSAWQTAGSVRFVMFAFCLDVMFAFCLDVMFAFLTNQMFGFCLDVMFGFYRLVMFVLMPVALAAYGRLVVQRSKKL